MRSRELLDDAQELHFQFFPGAIQSSYMALLHSLDFETDFENQLLCGGTHRAPQRTDKLVWEAWSSGL